MEIILNAINFVIIFALWLMSGWAFAAIADKIGKKIAARRHRKELVDKAVWMTCHNKGRI